MGMTNNSEIMECIRQAMRLAREGKNTDNELARIQQKLRENTEEMTAAAETKCAQLKQENIRMKALLRAVADSLNAVE